MSKVRLACVGRADFLHGITAFVLSYRLPVEGWNEGPAAPLQDAQRALEMHRFATGGHCFGMGRPGAPTAEWPVFYEAWLRAHGFMG